MCRSMKPFEVNILAGRAKTVAAKHYVMYELDLMSKNYADSWSKFGISDIATLTWIIVFSVSSSTWNGWKKDGNFHDILNISLGLT